MGTPVSNRNTVAALTVEATEGVPVAPASATDGFFAIHDGFTMNVEYEEIENPALSGSLGQSKTTKGILSSSAEFSEFFKHSGTEGVEPSVGPATQATLGAKTVNATEYNTIAGSTQGTATAAGTIVVDTGEGVNFERGQTVLIKDGVNGYSLRPILSISGDTLTLGFNLLKPAPALGVDLGKAITYKPADSGHVPVSIWNYVGNEGFVSTLAGGRVSGLAISGIVGANIISTYTLEGSKYFFDGIDITASTKYLDFTDDQGTVAVVVTEKYYQDPHELATAYTEAMNNATTETHLVEYLDATGEFKISTSTSAVLSLLWNTGTNTANTVGAKLGFSVAADDTGATEYTADSPQDYSAPYSPTYDSSEGLVFKNMEVLVGDFKDSNCFEGTEISLNVTNTIAPLDSYCSETGRTGLRITAREVTATVKYRVSKYDVDKHRRLRENDNIQLFVGVGEKSGGNWVPGKTGTIYLPTATIQSIDSATEDDLIVFTLNLKAYVANSLGEVYINHL